MSLLELAERCAKAQGPDRELDALIHIPECRDGEGLRVEFGGNVSWWVAGRERAWSGHLPRYTASLDAALTLAPEEWRVSNFGENEKKRGGWFCWLMRGSDVVGATRYVTDPGLATPALALCAAALRARAAQ